MLLHPASENATILYLTCPVKPFLKIPCRRPFLRNLLLAENNATRSRFPSANKRLKFIRGRLNPLQTACLL